MRPAVMPDTGARDLKTLREEKRMGREELAYRAGVTFSTIYRIETSKNSPLPAVRRAIAAALGVGVEDIKWPERTEQDKS